MNTTNKNKGFTLIEILLAIFVLEIGLLAIASFYTYSFKVSKIARNETIAANLATGLLDENLENSYANLTVSEGAKISYDATPDNPFSNFQKRVDIAYIDSNLVASFTGPDTNMKKITVTIYWTQESSERNFQIASIKAKH